MLQNSQIFDISFAILGLNSRTLTRSYTVFENHALFQHREGHKGRFYKKKYKNLLYVKFKALYFITTLFFP